MISGLLLFVMAFRQLTAGRLNERNTLVWLTGAVVCLGLWAFPQTAARIAALLGSGEAATLLALLSTVGLLAMLLQHAVELSLLQVRLREVAQQLAILQQQKSPKQAEQREETAGEWSRVHGGGRLGE